MVLIETRVVNQEGQPIPDAEVKFQWLFLNIFPQEAVAITDAAGKANFEMNQAARVRIQAHKGLSYDDAYVEIGIFGASVSPPNPQILTLRFSPFQPGEDLAKDIVENIKANSTILILAVGIPAGIVVAILAFRWISTGGFIDTAGHIASKTKESFSKDKGENKP